MALVTLAEVKASPYYCAYASCCTATELEIDAQIEGLIIACQAIIENYLGYEIEPTERIDKFEGDYSTSYFTDYTPVIDTPTPTLSYKKLQREFYETTAPSVTGDITEFEIEDAKTGLIRSNILFKENHIYTLTYTSGFEVIPQDLKEAVIMFIINMSQRIDLNNMSNVDVTVDRIQVDKIQTTSFGNGRNIKNIVVKDISDLNSIPIHVLAILRKYKRRY